MCKLEIKSTVPSVMPGRKRVIECLSGSTVVVTLSVTGDPGATCETSVEVLKADGVTVELSGPERLKTEGSTPLTETTYRLVPTGKSHHKVVLKFWTRQSFRELTLVLK